MANKYKEEEKRILAACEAFKSNPKSKSIPKLAAEYEVSYQRLLRRIHGGKSRSTRPPTRKRLLDEQEEAVKGWIKHLDDIGTPPTAEMIYGCANSILRDNPGINPPPELGKTWAYQFIKRLPTEYKWVKQTPEEPNRIHAEDIGVVQDFYSKLESTIKVNKIQPKNIYNADETGFQIGQGKKENVVSAYPNCSKGQPSKSSRVSITIG